MLEITGLSVAYGKHEALHDVSVRLDGGETLVVLGGNGAGKTTLLNAVAGLVGHRPGARIALDGEDLAGRPAERIVEAGIALVPEGRRLFASLTVAENLALGAFPRRARATRAQSMERVLTLFPRLGERLDQSAGTMSGGEQQMVAIGRALMSRPNVLMLDEPSLGLSPLMTQELFTALAGLKDMDCSVLLVEQNARRSLALAERAVVLETGRVAAAGTAAEIAADAAVSRSYLGAEASVQDRHDVKKVAACDPDHRSAAAGSVG